MSSAANIADAVVTELNSGVFNPPFTAQRVLLPLFTLPELADLKVTVVPVSRSEEMVSRGSVLNRFEIHIAVQKKISQIETDVPPLITLTDAIGDYMRFRRLAGVPEALWVKTDVEVIYAPEHLLNDRVFTSVLKLHYKLAGD